MILLKINGLPAEVGGDDLMAEFEDRITRWHTETSGWDAQGNYLTVRRMPDITEYDPEGAR